MVEPIQHKILSHLQSEEYRPKRPRLLAKELDLGGEEHYPTFRDALRQLMHEGRVVLGAAGTLMLPGAGARDEFVGAYRHNKRGFGFVVPSDPGSHEDLFVPEGQNGGAITGDVVRAKIVNRSQKGGKTLYNGRIVDILQRTQKRFCGTLIKKGVEWMVLPDGNTFTEPIMTPDAAARHIKPGTKVVVELTSFPVNFEPAVGVITEALGEAGEKDVDLRAVIVQHNLPEQFPEEVLDQARQSIDQFNPEEERNRRVDLTEEVICTIDPDDAKDYDDAISLRQLPSGLWELGVHIADVSYFVPAGTKLDEEAYERANSCYFPGFVIPMLPEILSNGVCSLQEGVPRLCKSAFITYDDNAMPVSSRFENTIIKSRRRLRYKEAQAILDNETTIPHPDGPKNVAEYPPEVVEHLHQMNALAKRLQKRRHHQGQIVLGLPEVDLVLDENGKVIDAVKEDESFTHTLIEMFMVEANEAVARLLDSLDVPFIRRTHPEPEMLDSEKLRSFVHVSGFKLPKQLDRKAIQTLLAAVKGKPESFAINLAVLKSLTRAEYSPQPLGHYALASEHYCHFTSPIRRYADLTVHRLLDAYFAARESGPNPGGRKKTKIDPESIPSFDKLVEIGRHLSFNERRADDAERELRQVKLLELLKNQIGEEFTGVVTSIANFGIFVQIEKYLVDGLIRYENLMDDWWEVDVKTGVVRGQRTGTKIGIGDQVMVYIVRVDVARRELDLAISKVLGRARKGATGESTEATPPPSGKKGKGKKDHRTGPRGQKSGGREKPQTGSGKPRKGGPGKRRGR
ncbi:MAG TPA: ribonuclease R [Tepidisphaeraceae bacterium]|jgi:ribonuclease R|nr:ribonuclease R [Tepidisphaeraceae bacterium]